MSGHYVWGYDTLNLRANWHFNRLGGLKYFSSWRKLKAFSHLLWQEMRGYQAYNIYMYNLYRGLPLLCIRQDKGSLSIVARITLYQPLYRRIVTHSNCNND